MVKGEFMRAINCRQLHVKEVKRLSGDKRAETSGSSTDSRKLYFGEATNKNRWVVHAKGLPRREPMKQEGVA